MRPAAKGRTGKSKNKFSRVVENAGEIHNMSTGKAATATGNANGNVSATIGDGTDENNEPERVYKNLRRPSGDRDLDMRKTGRHDEIMIQRKIRGEHESLNTRPGVECFDRRSFFMEGDNRSLYADLDENKNELLVSSSSFNESTWACSSCEASHELLPL
jgi:hypothetical protein